MRATNSNSRGLCITFGSLWLHFVPSAKRFTVLNKANKCESHTRGHAADDKVSTAPFGLQEDCGSHACRVEQMHQQWERHTTIPADLALRVDHLASLQCHAQTFIKTNPDTHALALRCCWWQTAGCSCLINPGCACLRCQTMLSIMRATHEISCGLGITFGPSGLDGLYYEAFGYVKKLIVAPAGYPRLFEVPHVVIQSNLQKSWFAEIIVTPANCPRLFELPDVDIQL